MERNLFLEEREMKKMKLFRLTLLMSFCVTGCFMELTDDDWDSEWDSGYYSNDGEWVVTETTFIPSEIRSEHDDVKPCEKGANDSTPYCFESNNQKWKNRCRGEECHPVSVQVHYEVDKDLGERQAVVVEAFDNRHFTGSPVATTSLSNFDTSRTGERVDTRLFLPSVSFYLRAFISREDQTVIPYSYQDMELVANKPMGVYGAISQIQSIDVYEGDNRLDDVDIVINKLFTKPGTEPVTHAKARIKIKTSDIEEIDNDRKIMIQFLDSKDIYRNPEYLFELNTASLKVVGKEGSAEFVTPNLEPGKYVVFVYIDSDANGFYDDGEFAQISTDSGSSNLIEVKEDRTALIELDLTSSPDLSY